METEIFDRRNKLVRKSNVLIEGKYNLPVREQKFLIYLASIINDNGDNLEYSVHIKDIEKALKKNEDKKWGSVYDLVYDIANSLKKKQIEIRHPNGSWGIINWFASVFANTETGLVTFEFSKYIKEQLVGLNKYYTKYKFGNILALRGGYSIRIYELLKMNQYRQKATYDLDVFRKLVGTTYRGINEETGKEDWLVKYPEYKAFKRSVIRHAQKELKAETDIYFELKEIREGRKVNKLVFYVFKNPLKEKKEKQSQLFEDAIVEEDNTKDDYNYNTGIITTLVGLGFTEPAAKSLYRDGFNKIKEDKIRKKIVSEERSLDEYLQEKIEYVHFQTQKGTVDNPPGLLIRAIQGDYNSKELKEKKKRSAAKKKNEEKKKTKGQMELQLKRLKNQLFEKELAITKGLVDSREQFLEELFSGEHPELWRGYDANLSLKGNFEKKGAANTTRYKVMNKVKEQYADAFKDLARLENDIKKLEKKVRRI